MLLEIGVLSSKNRLAQSGRDRFVRDHFATLNRELADDFTLGAEDPRNRARRVIVERRNLVDVVGVCEEDAARDPEQRDDDEQERDTGATDYPDGDATHTSQK